MKKTAFFAALFCLSVCFCGCSKAKGSSGSFHTGTGQGVPETDWQEDAGKEEDLESEQSISYTVRTKIADVMSDPVFGDYGRLIFPVDSGYYSGDTLGGLGLTWYQNMDPDKTVEIANYMKDHAGGRGYHIL